MRRPSDWDESEENATAAIRDELDVLRRAHADDLPLPVLRAAEAGVVAGDLDRAARTQLAANVWSRALVAGANDAGPTLSAEDEARLFARIRPEARAEP